VNGDGSLSRQELSQLPRTRGWFDELDLDGGITPDEFQDGLNTLPQSYVARASMHVRQASGPR
jgi:hypothetical protein